VWKSSLTTDRLLTSSLNTKTRNILDQILVLLMLVLDRSLFSGVIPNVNEKVEDCDAPCSLPPQTMRSGLGSGCMPSVEY